MVRTRRKERLLKGLQGHFHGEMVTDSQGLQRREGKNRVRRGQKVACEDYIILVQRGSILNKA